jgi:hypothetical protein
MRGGGPPDLGLLLSLVLEPLARTEHPEFLRYAVVATVASALAR